MEQTPGGILLGEIMLRKFLYSMLLYLYRMVGWLVRAIKPHQKEKKRERTATAFEVAEPKRKFRWVLEVDGVDAFMFNSCQRPNNSSNIFNAKLCDYIIPSTSKKMWEWEKSGDKRDVNLKLLDVVGDPIEEWEYKNVYPQLVDYGNLDYSSNEPCVIDVMFSYESVDLICVEK